VPVYWDSCCLLKLYCKESDSNNYLSLLEQSAEAPLSSILARTELFYSFQQKAARSETSGTSAEALFAQFEKDVEAGHIELAPLGEDVWADAREVARQCYQAAPAIFPRTLDGIHLATARKLKCPRIITCDQRMQAASERLGLSTYP